MPFNQTTVYIALAALALGFAGGYSLRDTQAKAEQAAALSAALKEQTRMQAVVDQTSAKYEEAQAQARAALATRGVRLKEIYRDVPPTPDACMPPAALRGLLYDAVVDANAAASGQSGKPVPPAARTPATP